MAPQEPLSTLAHKETDWLMTQLPRNNLPSNSSAGQLWYR